jgi:hypothetical protein
MEQEKQVQKEAGILKKGSRVQGVKDSRGIFKKKGSRGIFKKSYK